MKTVRALTFGTAFILALISVQFAPKQASAMARISGWWHHEEHEWDAFWDHDDGGGHEGQGHCHDGGGAAPEPATLVLLAVGAGVAGFKGMKRGRKRSTLPEQSGS